MLLMFFFRKMNVFFFSNKKKMLCYVKETQKRCDRRIIYEKIKNKNVVRLSHH